MVNRLKFYIDGAWVESAGKKTRPVVNPATEEAMYDIALGTKADVDKAVAAARRAFVTFSRTSRDERVALLTRIADAYKKRLKEIGAAISDEMGAPTTLAERAQAGAGLGHILTTIDVLKTYKFEEPLGSATVVREPVGVIGMITPWNWPLNQIACKVAPALAAGCTMILKPLGVHADLGADLRRDPARGGRAQGRVQSRERPRARGRRGDGRASRHRHDLVHRLHARWHRRGPAGGADRQARQPGAWRQVAQHHPRRRRPAEGDRRRRGALLQQFGPVVQRADPHAGAAGQDEGSRGASRRRPPSKAKAGDPKAEGTTMGPVVNQIQWEKIQGLIKKGIDEGATLVIGGLGRPEGLNKGFYVRPTVFADVTNDMTIAREEVFGPVLSIMGYKDEAEAVTIANDTPYGLAGYVWSGDIGARTQGCPRAARRQRQHQRRAQ